MTDTHRDTIMRLALRVGAVCAKIMDEEMRELTCKKLQADEIWAYVGKKQSRVTREDDRARVGDQWTFVALDADTKLVPVYLVGKRTTTNATIFMKDLASRLSNRVQLSTDGLNSYVTAVEEAFGIDVDYAQIVKAYEAEPVEPGRYSPPRVVSTAKTVLVGRPASADITTSHVERQNLTMRMSMRRFTRLTNGFSKKLENLQAAVALHFCHYNFCRIHKTLKITPAMAAGVSSRLWSIEEMVERTAWTGSPVQGAGGRWFKAEDRN
ncbi:MAG: IS1 family transposase [Alphaproteobacteria bacterium]|nr:IS1 family transposase [Alphaproteobacteria bacterium]